MEDLSKLLVSQSHLMQAASNFSDVCATFSSDLVARHPNPTSYSSLIALEGILGRLQHTINSIALVESQMHNSRAMLRRLLNESTARVPINSLPSEILSRIFSIVVSFTPCFPARGHREALLDIPSVCARWRHIAINTPSLWSYINLHISPSAYIPSLDHLRLLADRCRGMPIYLYLHDQCDTAEKSSTTELISTLQPYAASLSSLIILGRKTAPLAHALFTLCSSYGTSDSVKTLVISDALPSRGDPTFPLPAGLFRGLVHLELKGPTAEACVSVDELVATVSNCPALHTLLLRNLGIISQQQREYAPIPLPCLRLLQIRKVSGQGAQLFLSVLHPGMLELHVRLYIDSRFDELISCAQSFLARSNVVTLSVYAGDTQLGSYISSAPRLRSIIFNALGRRGSDTLKDSLHDTVAQLSSLRSLCVIHGNMSVKDVDWVKRIVQSKSLDTIGFLSCRFSLPSGEQLQNEHVGYAPTVSRGEIPESLREWLSERVERVIVGEFLPQKIPQGVDQLVQEIIR